MRRGIGVKGLAAVLLAALLAGGCTANPHAARDDNRYGVNTVEIAPNTQLVRTPQWDNRNIDMDGDGDREHLSGRNSINNPSVDLRSMTNPGGSVDMTSGIYPHTFTADRIADLANTVDGVANARCLLAGQTAILGVNLKRGIRPQQRDEIIQLVRQRILVQAPEFQRVHITTDRPLTRRIQRLADEMRAGHSLTLFNDDVMDLTRQIPAIGPNASPALPSR